MGKLTGQTRSLRCTFRKRRSYSTTALLLPLMERTAHAIALQNGLRLPKIGVVLIHRKAVRWCASIAVTAIGMWTVYALVYKPVLVHSPGEWDCACGDMYIKTTFRAIWNPFRDRQPEALADVFLSKLRANECVVGPELCRTSLPKGRVSEWKLSYREDAGDTASLYYKLTKYGDEAKVRLTGVGAIALRRSADGWRVIGYDCYF